MYYVGLDVHYRTSTYCILNNEGREVKCETIRGHWTKLLDRLAVIKGKWTVCFEATCGYGYLYRELSRMASRVIVAHPGQLRLIFRAKRKNDRVDSRKLAKLLYLDEVPAVYVPGEDVQSWRELIEHRRRVVDRQTVSKNSIRSLLRGHGFISPKGLWTKKGLAWLRQLPMPTSSSGLKRDLLLEELSEAKRGVRIVTKALDKIGRRHPGVVVLLTIPGVGMRTAETIVAYIDDPKRFSRSSQVASYFGLIPCQDASAGVNRMGHITKQGPGTARKYLVEAAWQGVYRSAMLTRKSLKIFPDNQQATLLSRLVVVRCVNSMFAIIWAPFDLSLIGSGQRPGWEDPGLFRADSSRQERKAQDRAGCDRSLSLALHACDADPVRALA